MILHKSCCKFPKKVLFEPTKENVKQPCQESSSNPSEDSLQKPLEDPFTIHMAELAVETSQELLQVLSQNVKKAIFKLVLEPLHDPSQEFLQLPENDISCEPTKEHGQQTAQESDFSPSEEF